jgi:hypothetical protein
MSSLRATSISWRVGKKRSSSINGPPRSAKTAANDDFSFFSVRQTTDPLLPLKLEKAEEKEDH